MGDKFDKFPITPEVEQEVIRRHQTHSVSICYVSSARAEAARYTVCDEDKLLKAYRAGSLAAVDWNSYYDDVDGNQGRAVRLAFNVDSVAAWARDDAAIVQANRQQHLARLNARWVTDTSPTSAMIGGSVHKAK